MGPVEMGRAAERLLNDDTMKAAFTEVEQSYLREWRSASTTDAREAIWYRVEALGDLLTTLKAIRDRGTRAERET